MQTPSFISIKPYKSLSKPEPKGFINISRPKILFFILGVLLCFLLFRLFELQLFKTSFLRNQGNMRTIHEVQTPSYRGLITDRRNTPLAISTPVNAIWANPKQISLTLEELKQLTKLLEFNHPQLLVDRFTNNQDKSFIYLKRNVPPGVAKQIMALKISGIYSQQEFKRFYPAGASTAQILGFTDIDDKGQAGLELGFEEKLRPQIGKKRILEDRIGHWLQDLEYLQMPHSGEDITLSIDLRLQTMALNELENAIAKYKAKAATAIILDVNTFEILSMVTAPSFNPNNSNERSGSQIRARALTDLFEPGSTIKAFSIASALETKKFTLDTIIDTENGEYSIGEHKIKDVGKFGKLSFKDVLVKSSNIGVSKIVLALPEDQVTNTFQALGLGQQTFTDFPGERSGILPPPSKSPFMRSTLAFGYGLMVTPLQLARAYAILANDGKAAPVSITKVLGPIKTEQVIPKDAANATFNILKEVMGKSGTGKRANIAGHMTAGKTGTIRVVGPKGYDPNRHVALFAGITPADNPKLATVIIVEEPDEKMYYGGLVAAPVYKNIVSKALHILNIAPNIATE